MKTFTLIAAVLAVVLLGVWYLGTESRVGTHEEDDRIVALSTFTVLADMVRVVGGDKVESVSLTKPGVEIHDYEPTPGDLTRASRADILFENGLNLENWAQKLRANLPDVPSVVLSEGVTEVPIAQGEYVGKPNPHAWMSPRQAMVYIDNIRNALSELAPEHAEYFAENARVYTQELETLDVQFAERISSIPEERRVLVTCEGAFSYLANDYGLSEGYLWAVNEESDGSPQRIARLVDLIREREVPAVFCESTVGQQIQMEVVSATGAQFGGLLYVDSLSDPSGPTPTHLRLLTHTVETVSAGLTGE